jgi:hypothetical protein
MPISDLLRQIREHRFSILELDFDLDEKSIRNPLMVPIRRATREDYQPFVDLEMPRPGKMLRPDRFYIWVPRPIGRNNEHGSTSSHGVRFTFRWGLPTF